MEGHSLDPENGSKSLSDLDDSFRATGPFAIVDVNIVGSSGAQGAIDMQEISLHHGLKPGADIITPLPELGKPAPLICPDEFQNMVLDRVEAPHLRRVSDL